MPRGLARSVAERLEEIDSKIAKAEDNLKELKAQRKEIEAQKSIALLGKVEAAAATRGISVEELLESML